MTAGSPDELAEAKALAVNYLLKGSLRRKADQIRITTQLIEVAGAGAMWAERYDTPLDTIFDIQDDIVQRVAGALSAQIDQVLLAAARDKPLTSLEAYDCWLRGMDLVRKGGIITQLVRICIDQATNVGFEYAIAECTGAYSQHLVEAAGFTSVYELPYADFLWEGEAILKNVPAPHAKWAFYEKQLN